MAPARAWAGVLLVPALLVGAGFAARRAAARAWDGFVSYDTPFAFEGASDAATESLSPRVVVVLVDGMGLAPSQDLPFLRELRARGADYAVSIGLPSLSLPARAVMFSGAWSDIHGQITNHNPRRLKVDHLFRSARRAGRTTGLSAGANIQKMFAPDVSMPVALAVDPETAPLDVYLASLRRQAEAARDLVSKGPALAVVEMYVADEVAHNWGAASEEYRRALAAADDEVRRLAALLDLTHATFVVTGDHGHVDIGGHGGPEPPVMQVPLVLAGAGVKAGVRGTARQIDVAPTVAALLGIPIPASSQGRPLVDALDTDPARKWALLERVLVQRGEFVTAYRDRLALLDDATHVPRPPIAYKPGPDIADLQVDLDAIDADEEQFKQERITLEKRQRRVTSAAMALLPLLILGGLGAAGLVLVRDVRRGAVAAAIAFALYHAALPTLGLAYSISAINKDEQVGAFFAKDMALGFAAAVLAAALAVWPVRGSGLVDRARQAWIAAALLAALFVFKIALVYWWNGVFLRWYVPDQYWGFGFYLDALALMAIGLGAPALLAVAGVVRSAPPCAAALRRAV